ncbi:hypothetical protein H0H10_29100 [Streptomyces sp. TRM S81-3]|uniref:Uncharacterized protein n=1 Tax=Streptomyces griseicoloratus TaxID=2752516 RepID=A0A926LAS2_9ACTN|nr:hypothetical protein [Streptomyces griseicoloratus]MBD0423168.1 hypothetical protein [Streptomyces griseicoloratus]
MGERPTQGGRADRRPAHPEAAALLAAALREESGGRGGEGEVRALAAYRAARDTGAHRTARTRRRDDWRPRELRGGRRTLKSTLSVLLASLTLGGVAYAAIGAAGSGGSAGNGADGDRARPSAAASTPGRPAPRPSAPPSAGSPRPDRPDRPSAAGDTEAHCRVYERLEGRGRALDATAWRRLVEEAGGEKNVAAYCAAVQARPSAGDEPGKGNGAGGAGGTGKPDKSGNPGGSQGNPGGTAGQGNGGADGGRKTGGGSSRGGDE